MAIDVELTVTLQNLFVFASHEFANKLRIIYSKDLVGYHLEKKCVLCRVKAKNAEKNMKQRNLSSFVTISMH